MALWTSQRREAFIPAATVIATHPGGVDDVHPVIEDHMTGFARWLDSPFATVSALSDQSLARRRKRALGLT